MATNELGVAKLVGMSGVIVKTMTFHKIAFWWLRLTYAGLNFNEPTERYTLLQCVKGISLSPPEVEF